VADVSVPAKSTPVSQAKKNLVKDIEAFMKANNILFFTQQWSDNTSLAS
jgi:hypothetical protein